MKDYEGLSLVERTVQEAVGTGLSRVLIKSKDDYERPLSDFAMVVRGIATGANEYFFMTKTQIEERKLPSEFFIRAVGRTRDTAADRLGVDDLAKLEQQGRATYLLNITSSTAFSLPLRLQQYIAEGETDGIHERALIKSRNPWYKMEQRTVPSILFAYLGRRNARFILNNAGVVPLTGFLCVNPRHSNVEYVKDLWSALNDPRTIANLPRVGKSYGDGAVKVEPSGLRNLPIPGAVISDYRLDRHSSSANSTHGDKITMTAA